MTGSRDDTPRRGRRQSLHGRRLGRPLRPGRKALLTEVLPAMRVTPLAEPGALDPTILFPERPRAVWLEIGFGAGEHLASQAAANPDVGIVGAEIFVNGVASLLARLDPDCRDRVRLYQDDARDLLTALSDRSVDRAFVLFPDPWPKTRHHRRRIIQRDSVDALARVLRPGAELRIATDDAGYLGWILERLIGHPCFEWLARRPADWRDRPDDWPATRYEAKARAAGRAPVFLRFRRRETA